MSSRCQWWPSNLFLYFIYSSEYNNFPLQWHCSKWHPVVYRQQYEHQIRTSNIEYPVSGSQESQLIEVCKQGDGLHSLECCYTITGACYADLLRKLSKKIKKILLGKMTKRMLFHQDKAPAHKSTVVRLPSRNVALNSSRILPIHQIWPPVHCLFTNTCWTKCENGGEDYVEKKKC